MKTIQKDKKQFSLRPTPSAHERLSEAAAWRGQSLNSFVLGAAMREADEVLTCRDKIELTPKDAELMLQLLDSEPEMNLELAKAFRKRAEVLGE